MGGGGHNTAREIKVCDEDRRDGSVADSVCAT